MPARYVEYPPDPSLVPWVRCYWVFELEHAAGLMNPADAGANQTVVADGHPEMVFHYGDHFSEAICNARGETVLNHQPDCLFAGQLTRPLVLRASGRVGMLSVRFWPWGAHRFVGVSMHAYTDRRVALDALPGQWLDDVPVRMRSCANDAARVALVESALLARVAATPAIETNVSEQARELLRAAGNAPLDTLHQSSALGERQFARRFRDVTGVSPRLLASIFRFRVLFDALKEDTQAPWLTAAIDAGYFDQAHMIRDFRRFAGQPPRAFYRSLDGLSAAMVGGVR
ncbi:MAG: helix-turn-helix domain-containing protein [Betaproteobacteria bacterium]